MSLVPQSEWDEVRLELLSEAAQLTELTSRYPLIFDVMCALTRAFDRPVPVYSVYRKLRSFKAGQWPLLKNLIANADSQTALHRNQFDDLLVRLTQLLDLANSNRDVLTEALEIELEVLKTLIDEFN